MLDKILIALFGVNAVTVVATVGKERKLLTPEVAAAVVVVNTALIIALLRRSRH